MHKAYHFKECAEKFCFAPSNVLLLAKSNNISTYKVLNADLFEKNFFL